ncbi:transcription repressor OFP16-like [Henckelia pumila]|uniref:transcription repressor OFP16-like n=1 Tax=Henckelia pumila TaxID=405737 RepID=UPI003C6E8299
MSNILWKSFNLCFSKFKCLPIIAFAPSPLPIQEQEYHNNSNINNPSSSSAVTITTFDTAEIFDDYDMHDDSIPDFSSAFTSHRFFFSTPGSSNSIFDQPRRLTAPGGVVISGGVAVQKFTTDPYAEFKKSMQEMIEAQESTGHDDVKSCSGEFLHELLLCYLTLNPKHTHKFIVDAFADIVVSLVSPPSVSCRKTGHPRRRHRATPSPRV